MSLKETYQKSQSFSNLCVKNDHLRLVSERITGFYLHPETAAIRKYPYGWAAVEDICSSEKQDKKFALHNNEIEDLARLDVQQYLRFLDYRYRYEVFPREKMLENYPPCVQIEPTSICNYRCVFCYQTDHELTRKSNGHMGVMSLQLFKNIIDQLEGQVEAISLASRGEPTVCKALGDMLLYMKGKFLASKMNTNASLLTEKLCHEILQSELVTLVFSADAAGDPEYGQLRVNGSFEKVIKNVEMFNRIKSQHYSNSKTLTRVSGVKVNESQNIVEMENVWGALVDQVAFVNYCPWENCYDSAPSKVVTPCSDLWRRMFIWWDGQVNPCDVDYRSLLCLGKVPISSIQDLWRGPLYSQYRQQHLQFQRCQINPCKNCYLV